LVRARVGRRDARYREGDPRPYWREAPTGDRAAHAGRRDISFVVTSLRLTGRVLPFPEGCGAGSESVAAVDGNRLLGHRNIPRIGQDNGRGLIMKAQDVIRGAVYEVKVSGRLARVKIICPHSLGGWYGINTNTGRPVRIRRSASLRPLLESPPVPGLSREEL